MGEREEAPKLVGEVWRGVVRIHGGEDLLAVAEQDGAYVVRWWHDGAHGPARWRELVAWAQETAALREALRAALAASEDARARAASDDQIANAARSLVDSLGEYVRQSMTLNPEWRSGILAIEAALLARKRGQLRRGREAVPAPADALTEGEECEIEARANAATPGRWWAGGTTLDIVFMGEDRIADAVSGRPIEDAAHIARMDPPTTLRLLAALRTERARADRAEALAKAERERAEKAEKLAEAERALRKSIEGGYSTRMDEAALRVLGVEP